MTNPAGCLVLVRHGASIWTAQSRVQGSSDPPLSELGARQALSVGRRLAWPEGRAGLGLAADPPRAILHSPQGRAASTAHAIATALGMPDGLTVDEGLREIGHGSWEGLTLAEVQARYPREFAAWRADASRAHAPGGESLADAATRADGVLRRALASLVEVTPGASEQAQPWSILVAHDGIHRVVLMRALGLDLDRFWAFPFALCGLTILTIVDGMSRLSVHNATDHLFDLPPQPGERALSVQSATDA